MPEGHTNLWNNSGQVDSELVGEPDPFGAEIEHHGRGPWLIREDLLQHLDLARPEPHGRDLHGQYRCGALLEARQHFQPLQDHANPGLVTLVESSTHRDDEIFGELVAVFHQRARE